MFCPKFAAICPKLPKILGQIPGCARSRLYIMGMIGSDLASITVEPGAPLSFEALIVPNNSAPKA